jgi:hypothetical protein
MTSPSVAGLVVEVVEEYDMAMKVSVLNFRYHLDASLREEYKSLRLLGPPPRPPPVEFGKVYMPGHPFVENHTTVSNSLRFVHKRMLKTLEHIPRVWAEKLKGDLFMDLKLTPTLTLPCDLDSFKALQRKHTKSLVDRLTNDWRKGILNHISDVLQQVDAPPAAAKSRSLRASKPLAAAAAGSAAFNLYNNDLESHLASDLHRLLRCVEMMMVAQVCLYLRASLAYACAFVCHVWFVGCRAAS